ncbi:hypothetical protein J7355_17090 [Endozoicomonas sp. G2_2]|nr:hypothetical protein [Endozoicomonas sp. G2_2]
MSEYDPFSKVARRDRHRKAIIGLGMIGIGLLVIYALPMLTYTRFEFTDNTTTTTVSSIQPGPAETQRETDGADTAEFVASPSSPLPHDTAATQASASAAPTANATIESQTKASLTLQRDSSISLDIEQIAAQPNQQNGGAGGLAEPDHGIQPSLAYPEPVISIGPTTIQQAVPVGVDEVPVATAIMPQASNSSPPVPVSGRSGTAAHTDDQASVAVPYRRPARPEPSIEADLVTICTVLGRRINTPADELCPADRTLRLGSTGMNNPVMGQVMKQKDAAPRVMVIAGVSGTQTGSVDTLLHWIDDLAATKDISWLTIPIVNPDGLLATPPRSSNFHGVILTRNLPTKDWSHTATLAQPTSLRVSGQNPGSHGGSESEVAALVASISAFSPDLIVELRAGDGLVTFHGDGEIAADWAPLLVGYEPYEPGSLAQYASGERGVDVLQISVPSEDHAPARRVRLRILDHLRDFVRTRYSLPAQP